MSFIAITDEIGNPRAEHFYKSCTIFILTPNTKYFAFEPQHVLDEVLFICLRRFFVDIFRSMNSEYLQLTVNQNNKCDARCFIVLRMTVILLYLGTSSSILILFFKIIGGKIGFYGTNKICTFPFIVLVFIELRELFICIAANCILPGYLITMETG